ncbi:auxin transport protein BIG, partial [Tanacetum coccineum]
MLNAFLKAVIAIQAYAFHGSILSSSALEMLVPGHEVGNVMGEGRGNVDNIRKISKASVEISDNKSSCGDRYDEDYFPGKRKRGKDYKEGM